MIPNEFFRDTGIALMGTCYHEMKIQRHTSFKLYLVVIKFPAPGVSKLKKGYQEYFGGKEVFLCFFTTPTGI